MISEPINFLASFFSKQHHNTSIVRPQAIQSITTSISFHQQYLYCNLTFKIVDISIFINLYSRNLFFSEFIKL